MSLRTALLMLRPGARVVRNMVGTTLWLGLAVLAWLLRTVEALPERIAQGLIELWADLFTLTTWRGRLAGFVLLLGLAALPGWANTATIGVVTTALWFAYAGQTWNLLSGFAGRLSLGHALFTGLGAWIGVGLVVQGGFSPWLGLAAAIPTAAAAGAVIGALGCRSGLGGVHFALVTLVFAELGRIGANQFDIFGSIGGGALPLVRSGPVLFYYLMLGLVVLALVLCRLLVRSRLGYRWLAVREDADAAAAAGVNVFRTRVAAVAISAALIAPAGALQAFQARVLEPDQLFSLSRSVDILLGAAVGGIGTLFGPVLGALLVSPLGDALSALAARSHHDLSALKPFCWGTLLVLFMLLRPGGLWPWLARRFRLLTPPPAGGGAP